MGFIVVGIVVSLEVPLPSVPQIHAFARDAGWLGAIAFVVAYGIFTLTPVPKSILNVAAGVAWGFGLGSALVYVGALIGAGLGFAIGRALGRTAVERFTGAKVGHVDALLRKHGLASVIGARLIPVLPFTVINYSASLTSVSRRDYGLGTAIGIIPGTLAYSAIGAFGLDPGPGLFIALGVLGGLTLAAVVVVFVVRHRAKAREEEARSGSASA